MQIYCKLASYIECNEYKYGFWSAKTAVAVLRILHNFRIYIAGRPQNHISDTVSFHSPIFFFPSTNNKVIPKQLRRIYVKVFGVGSYRGITTMPLFCTTACPPSPTNSRLQSGTNTTRIIIDILY